MQKNIVFTLYQDNKIISKETILGNITNQNVSFVQGEMNHVLDLKEETFLRENNEYSFFLDVKNKKCEIQLKKEKNILQLAVNYAIILQNEKEISLIYKTESTEEEIKLNLLALEGEIL